MNCTLKNHIPSKSMPPKGLMGKLLAVSSRRVRMILPSFFNSIYTRFLLMELLSSMSSGASISFIMCRSVMPREIIMLLHAFIIKDSPTDSPKPTPTTPLTSRKDSSSSPKTWSNKNKKYTLFSFSSPANHSSKASISSSSKTTLTSTITHSSPEVLNESSVPFKKWTSLTSCLTFWFLSKKILECGHKSRHPVKRFYCWTCEFWSKMVRKNSWWKQDNLPGPE